MGRRRGRSSAWHRGTQASEEMRNAAAGRAAREAQFWSRWVGLSETVPRTVLFLGIVYVIVRVWLAEG